MTGTSSFYNNNKISKDAKDWIKLICLRSWAKKKKPSFSKYVFPKLLEGHRYSTNKYIEETINELIDGNRIILTNYYEVENYIKEIEKKGEEKGIKIGIEKGIKIGIEKGKNIQKEKVKESQLQCAFYIFYFTKNIDKFYFDYNYKMEDVLLFLVQKVDAVKPREDEMNMFIDALTKRKLIVG